MLYCNPRGSSGYDEAWGRAVRWPECENDPGSGWGGVDFDDVMACVEEGCRRFDWVDPERLGIMGGSYGGYMTSWAIGHTDRFKAACSERSCNNLLTLEANSDIAGTFRGVVGPNSSRRPRRLPPPVPHHLRVPDDHACPYPALGGRPSLPGQPGRRTVRSSAPPGPGARVRPFPGREPRVVPVGCPSSPGGTGWVDPGLVHREAGGGAGGLGSSCGVKAVRWPVEALSARTILGVFAVEIDRNAPSGKLAQDFGRR